MPTTTNSFDASAGNAFVASLGNARNGIVELPPPPEPTCSLRAFATVLYQGQLIARCNWMPSAGFPDVFDVVLTPAVGAVQEVVRFSHFHTQTSQWNYAPSDTPKSLYSITESWFGRDSLGVAWLAQARQEWNLAGQGSAPSPVSTHPYVTWRITRWPGGDATVDPGGFLASPFFLLNPFYPSPKSQWGSPSNPIGLARNLPDYGGFGPIEIRRLTTCELVCEPTIMRVTISDLADQDGYALSDLNGSHDLTYHMVPPFPGPNAPRRNYQAPFDGFFRYDPVIGFGGSRGIYSNPITLSSNPLHLVALDLQAGGDNQWRCNLRLFTRDPFSSADVLLQSMVATQAGGATGFWGNVPTVDPSTGSFGGFENGSGYGAGASVVVEDVTP